jgi:NitT/TauT family transport system permease protein
VTLALPRVALPRAYRKIYRGAAGLVLAAAAAQLALWAGRVNQDEFPLPSSVLTSAADLARNGIFLASVGSTMVAWAEAMAVTILIGVPVGLLLGVLPWAESAVRPVIEFLRPIPSVVLIPLVLLIVQDNQRTELAVIVFASVWPVLINTIYGIRDVDPVAKETLRSFGFGPVAVAGRVSLPSAAPFIATGTRIAASVALVVAVAAELIGAGMNGIGAYLTNLESGTAATAPMIAVAVWAGLIGIVINAVFTGAERRVFRWHHALTRTTGVAGR